MMRRHGWFKLAVGWAWLLSAWPAFSGTSTFSPATASRLDAEVPSIVQHQRVASVSLAIIADGSLRYTGAFGQATATRPATADTVYNVASLAKPLTAALTLRLIADGALALDEPLASSWVDPDLIGDARVNLLTPRLILSHQTGFPNWRDGKLAFQFTPGTDFGYSGEGYEYLARALSKKLGRRFESLMRQQVLRPLQMQHSTQTQAPWLQDRMAVPFDADGKALTPQIAASALASDDLYTTAGNYARFVINLMQPDHLPKALQAEQGRVQVDRRAALCHVLTDAACPTSAGFGLGFEVFELDGHRYWMHTGQDAGTFALAYFSPDRRSGLVLLTNSSHGASVVLPILDVLALDPAFNAWLRYLAAPKASVKQP